jgi:hypothetical protein
VLDEIQERLEGVGSSMEKVHQGVDYEERGQRLPVSFETSHRADDPRLAQTRILRRAFSTRGFNMNRCFSILVQELKGRVQRATDDIPRARHSRRPNTNHSWQAAGTRASCSRGKVEGTEALAGGFSWTIADDRVWFLGFESGSLRLYCVDLASGSLSDLGIVEADPGGGLAFDAARKRLLFTTVERSESDLVMAHLP